MQIEHSAQDGVHRYECWDDYGCSVVASAVIQEQDGHAYLHGINVSSGHRGRGVGTELLKQILEDFDGTHIVADVFEARVQWYKKHGFEPVGETNNLIRIVKPPQFFRVSS